MKISIVASGGGARYYPAYDGNGNVSQYVCQTGAEVARFEDDPFGNLTVEAYSNATSFRYRFSTKPRVRVIGLYYYGYQWFDPVTGRWPSRDPMGERGRVNLHGFVGNDWVNDTDYLGLDRNDRFPEIVGRKWPSDPIVDFVFDEDSRDPKSPENGRPSREQYARDYVRRICHEDRYIQARGEKGKEFHEAVKRGGYATEVRYAENLLVFYDQLK